MKNPDTVQPYATIIILAVIVAVLPGWKPLAAWGVISLSAGLREICEALSKIRDELRKDQ